MCGPLSAARALQLLQHEIDPVDWLAPFQSKHVRGVTVRTVLALCRRLEPQARLVRSKNKSVEQLSFPCILLVNNAQHCVVAQSSSHDRVRIWDPSDLREKTLSEEQLKSFWTGEVILLKPSRWVLHQVKSVVLVLVMIVTWASWLRGSLQRSGGPHLTSTEGSGER